MIYNFYGKSFIVFGCYDAIFYIREVFKLKHLFVLRKLPSVDVVRIGGALAVKSVGIFVFR